MTEPRDRDEIRQLISTYNIEGDRGRIDAMAAVFADDAVLVLPAWRAQGRAAIAKGLSGGVFKAGSAPERRVVRHHLTTCHITFDGEGEAHGRTYWINYSENGPDHSGVYVDRFRCIAGAWKIVAREVRLDWRAPGSTLSDDMRVGARPEELGPLPVITAD